MPWTTLSPSAKVTVGQSDDSLPWVDSSAKRISRIKDCREKRSTLDERVLFGFGVRFCLSLNAPDTGLRARSADYIYELVREEFLAKR